MNKKNIVAKVPKSQMKMKNMKKKEKKAANMKVGQKISQLVMKKVKVL